MCKHSPIKSNGFQYRKIYKLVNIYNLYFSLLRNMKYHWNYQQEPTDELKLIVMKGDLLSYPATIYPNLLLLFYGNQQTQKHLIQWT